MNLDESREIEEEQSKVRNALEIEEISMSIDDDRLRFPTKTLVSSIILFVIGATLLIAGLIEELVEDDKTKGMAMWIIGAITFIPGSYYTFLFVKAYRAKTVNERMQILRDIPEM